MNQNRKIIRRFFDWFPALSQRLVVYLAVHVVLLFGGVLTLVAWKKAPGQAIGTSVIATAAAGFALFAYVLLTDRWSRRVEGLLDAGLRQWWPGRSVRMREEYERRLAEAAEAIDLLGFGQQHFRDDQKGRFQVWVAKGVRVRLLLLDPSFPQSGQLSVAQVRDNEEGVPLGSIGTDVRAFLREVHTQGLRDEPQFGVRLYRALPMLNIFRIDDEMFWGPYLVGEVSRNSPTFLLGRGELFTRFLAHFDAIWNSDDLSRPVDWTNDV